MLPMSVNPTVLVIDDVEATRRGLAELLRLRGYNACEAASGADGLRALRDDPTIRAVVLDLRMPGSNGYWFREEQLKDPTLASIPVIVFTGVDPSDADMNEKLDVSNVLFKPVSVDQLFEAVSRYCNV